MTAPQRRNNGQDVDQRSQEDLYRYLEALLREVPETLEAEPPAEPEPVGSPPPLASVPPPGMEAPAAADVPVSEPPTESPEPQPEAQSPPANERPPWAQAGFQCLLFQVVGISLAVPLAKLNGVIPWPAEITPLPNHSALFLGLVRHQERNVKVVDTAEVVLPERHRANGLAPAAERSENIILLDEGRWGLACDSIGEVLTLEPEQVRWRTAQGKRPWLAGTVREQLCALVDADAMVHLLATGEEAGHGTEDAL